MCPNQFSSDFFFFFVSVSFFSCSTAWIPCFFRFESEGSACANTVPSPSTVGVHGLIVSTPECSAEDAVSKENSESEAMGTRPVEYLRTGSSRGTATAGSAKRGGTPQAAATAAIALSSARLSSICKISEAASSMPTARSILSASSSNGPSGSVQSW